jgi:biotin carboxylase
VYSHVPTDRSYTIPSDYDPNLALALVWGDSMDAAKARGREFLEKVIIEGADSSGNPIKTNLPYLEQNIDRLLTF